MSLVRSRMVPWLMTFSLLLPLAAHAAFEHDVSRGEFLRDAIDLFQLPVTLQSEPRPHVPASLLPYVETADQHHALTPFEDGLFLARPITRGQAAEVLTLLLDLPSSQSTATFRDVPSGTLEEDAVRLAVDRGWLRPLRVHFFGAETVLTSTEETLFLRKVVQDIAPSLNPDGGSPSSYQLTVPLRAASEAELPKEALLKAVWKIIVDQYVHAEKINSDEAAYSAAQALVDSLHDPYSTFLRPLPAQEFQSQLQGEISGIGAQVDMKDNILTIESPLPGSPAAQANLKPGDQILAVDGESLKGLDFLQAVSKVRGPKGSSVKLHIGRDGTEFDVTVTRDVVKVPELEVTWQGDIAIVRILQFGQITERDIRGEMTKIAAQNPSGLILDLRDNPGGLLDAAQVVLDTVLPKGTSFIQVIGRDGSSTEHTDEEPVLPASIKMVVLVNKGSASASEIVAGALQDTKRATILGETSYGKGTVQQVIEFSDTSSLKLTIAEWETPFGRSIDGKGIEPDVKVVQPEGGRDEQFIRALNILR